MLLTFDIETLPCIDPAAIAELSATIKPPGNIKKVDSIALWMAENREDATRELIANTSFDGTYGRVACICYAADDGEVINAEGANEREVITAFYAGISDLLAIPHNRGTAEMQAVFCGHNIAGFDLPFLKHRSIILGIKPPAQLLKAMNAKPWDNCIFDTMLAWSSDREKRASMDRLCKAFGIAGKDGFDGSMVATTWPTDPGKVIAYCKDDVRRTRAMHKRITFQD